MGFSLTHKILAHHTKDSCEVGEYVSLKPDIVMGNDVTASLAIKYLESFNIDRVFDPEKVILVLDHFTPNKDVLAAAQSQMIRNFALRHKISHYFEGGRAGIEHALLPELGLVVPGDLVFGGDSHTCTYGGLGAFATGVGSTDLAAVMAMGELWFQVPECIKIEFNGKLKEWVSAKDLILYVIKEIGTDGALGKSIEFYGETLKEINVDGRLTLSNMVVEAGAISGIIEADELTKEFGRRRWKRKAIYLSADPDASYAKIYKFDSSKIDLQVALPHSPGNSVSITEVPHTEVDQVIIGSCTNGRLSDLRMAAQILKKRRVNPKIRLIIVPATPQIYRQALREGLIKIFLDAEALISPPTCGACFGGHMGILAKGEICLSTTNRNFEGRMGHPESKVYLSGPAVAASTAIAGFITHPDNL